MFPDFTSFLFLRPRVDELNDSRILYSRYKSLHSLTLSLSLSLASASSRRQDCCVTTLTRLHEAKKDVARSRHRVGQDRADDLSTRETLE